MRTLCLLAVLLALPAAAQDAASLFPLGTGDTWLYDTLDGRYERWTVVGDTLVGAAAYRLVDRALLESSGQRVGGSREAVRVERSPDGSTGGIDNPTGGLGLNGVFLLAPASGSSATIVVGGLSYTVPGAWSDWQLVGTGYYRYVDLASGVGFVERGTRDTSPPSPPSASFRLRYAEVGGAVYGANPVAGGTGPARPRGVVLTAGPSPASSAVTLRLDETDRAQVEVFSATGRRVYAGEATGGVLRLDVSGWAPGVYLARAAADGQTATARLVVAR